MPFDALPNVLDPDEGFIVTANQAVIDPATGDYPYFLTDDWDRGYRAQRIRDLLEQEGDAVGGRTCSISSSTTATRWRRC